jgi:hypothetical protein
MSNEIGPLWFSKGVYFTRRPVRYRFERDIRWQDRYDVHTNVFMSTERSTLDFYMTVSGQLGRDLGR